MNIFVNFTNHPSAYWDENQRKEALKYGMIRDMPFPSVDPESDEAYIDSLAQQVIKRLRERDFDTGSMQREGGKRYGEEKGGELYIPQIPKVLRAALGRDRKF